jgi:surfactin synthase thioesterase subunit
MGKWSSARFLQQFTRSMKKVPLATLSTRLEEVLKVDVTGKLRQIYVPMIYLGAKQDWLVSKRSMQTFDAAGATVVQLDGPHFLLQAQPAECRAIVAQFLTETRL